MPSLVQLPFRRLNLNRNFFNQIKFKIRSIFSLLKRVLKNSVKETDIWENIFPGGISIIFQFKQLLKLSNSYDSKTNKAF